MNRKQIIQRIRQRYANRQALNLSAVKREDRKLVEAVYAVQPYWGWKTALADAGIDYDDIRVNIRQTVECRICGKRFQLLACHVMKIHDTTPEEYRDDYPQAELSSEALRARSTGRLYTTPHPEFLPHWEPIYTREYVLDRLHEYSQRDFWMNFETISQIDCSLIAALHKYVETSWDDGLRLIGLDPVEYRGLVRDEDFQLRDFRQWLDDRERQGLDCTHSVVIAEIDEWRRPPRLFVWALQRFGNWRAALEAAGVDLSQPVYGGHRFQTRSEVLAEIRRLRKEGADLSHVAVNLTLYGSQLTSAGSRLFGRWEAALDAAGIARRLRGRRTYYTTTHDVLQAIAARIENQFSLAPLDVYFGTRSDVPLWKKSFELLGSWQKAVKEAGGGAGHQREAGQTLFPTQAKTIAALQCRKQEGKSLAIREMTCAESDKHLYAMATGFFGSWRAAVLAAGFDPKEYHQWNINPRGKYSSRQQVLAAIRRRHSKGKPLNARGLTHGADRDVPLVTMARKVFGSWGPAVTAAGIDYDNVVRKQQDYEALQGMTYRTYPTRDDVVGEIQRRLKEQLPVTYRAISHGDAQTRDNALLAAGKKFFSGDWDRALRAAGVDLTQLQPDWVRQRKKRKRQQGTPSGS